MDRVVLKVAPIEKKVRLRLREIHLRRLRKVVKLRNELKGKVSFGALLKIILSIIETKGNTFSTAAVFQFYTRPRLLI